jgi:hypothetical protein
MGKGKGGIESFERVWTCSSSVSIHTRGPGGAADSLSATLVASFITGLVFQRDLSVHLLPTPGPSLDFGGDKTKKIFHLIALMFEAVSTFLRA